VGAAGFGFCVFEFGVSDAGVFAGVAGVGAEGLGTGGFSSAAAFGFAGFGAGTAGYSTASACFDVAEERKTRRRDHSALLSGRCAILGARRRRRRLVGIAIIVFDRTLVSAGLVPEEHGRTGCLRKFIIPITAGRPTSGSNEVR
jgi:hypothetical protein